MPQQLIQSDVPDKHFAVPSPCVENDGVAPSPLRDGRERQPGRLWPDHFSV
jgi:hypothetical protein